MVRVHAASAVMSKIDPQNLIAQRVLRRIAFVFPVFARAIVHAGTALGELRPAHERVGNASRYTTRTTLPVILPAFLDSIASTASSRLRSVSGGGFTVPSTTIAARRSSPSREDCGES